MLPLIDAITGVPGRPFPDCGSEVVPVPGSGTEAFQQNSFLSENLTWAVYLHQRFTCQNLAQSAGNVKPGEYKNPQYRLTLGSGTV
jgi:hypothetical protein